MTSYVNMNKDNKYIDKECMICFEEVDTKIDYIKCYNCNKLFHLKCMNDWKLKRPENQRFSTCVHCTKEDLVVHTFKQQCCIGCWNWMFPKQRKKEFTEIMVAYD